MMFVDIKDGNRVLCQFHTKSTAPVDIRKTVTSLGTWYRAMQDGVLVCQYWDAK